MISTRAVSVVLALALLPISPAVSKFQARDAKAKLKGAVMLDLEARASGGTKVSFRRGRSTTAVITAKDGTYQVELAPGLYRVNTHSIGFCPVRRSEFELAPAAQVQLNLPVMACGIADYIQYDEKGRYKGELEKPWPPHGYDSFAVRRAKRVLHLVVRYAVLKREGSEAHYFKSPPGPGIGRAVRVLITYDLNTIVADEAKLNTRTMELCAQGNLIVEDGQHTTHPDAVRLQFQGGRAVLEEQTVCPGLQREP